MPHRVAGRKLSRQHAHRMSMLGNLAVSVIR
jgi:ribosomal protein L17